MEPIDHFVEIRGLKLHYLDWGNPKATPMLLVHGARGLAHIWDTFAQVLAGQYHIIALDPSDNA